MKQNFAASLAATLKYEGGYSNHPSDPGGATMKGVTQATYNAWRRRNGLEPRSVRQLSQAELESIYRRDYWDKCGCDSLPSGVDLAVFDYAVNSGPARAIKCLQTVVGVSADGIVGPRTINAAKATPGCAGAICDARLSFVRRLKTFSVFGKGWASRIADVKRKALAMAKATPRVQEKTIIDEVGDFLDWTRHPEEAAPVPTQAPPPTIKGQAGFIVAAIIAVIGSLQAISAQDWSVVLTTPNHDGLTEIAVSVAIAIANVYAPAWVKIFLPTPKYHA